MPRRRRGEPPRLVRHKASGLGYCTIHGKRIYLGKFGSKECRRAYRAELTRWEEEQKARHGRTLYMGRGATVAQLVRAWMEEVAPTKYVMDDAPTSSMHSARIYLVDGLAQKFGDLLADEFRHADFEEFRRAYVAKGYSRNTIKKIVSHVLVLFRWGHKRGAVSAETLTSITTSPEPDEGEERDPIEPVDRQAFDAVLRLLENGKGRYARSHLRLATMLRLQDLVGMRPGELCRMKRSEIRQDGTVLINGKPVEIGGEPWIFQPSRFKTRKRGKYLAYLVGPQARELLTPWLPEDSEAFVWPAGDGSSVSYHTYRNSVTNACRRAGVEPFRCNQLRHSCLTRYGRIAGLEAASQLVGHASPNTTMAYVQKSLGQVVGLVEKYG